MPSIPAAAVVAALALVAGNASADVPPDPPKKGGCSVDSQRAPTGALGLVALALVARRRPRPQGAPRVA